MQLSEAGLCYMLLLYRESDGLSEVGYCLKDMDGDGSDELLVAPVAGDGFMSGMIFDLYTLRDGQSVQLITGGERDRYYLLSDGSIYNEGSYSAAESVYRKLVVSGGTLTETMQIYCNAAAEDGSVWKVSYSSGEMQPISEEEALSLISACQVEIVTPEYTPFGN